jgi:hypothetical protein
VPENERQKPREEDRKNGRKEEVARKINRLQ